jgi:hypothetical protein
VEATPVPVEVPYQEQWASSAHNAVDTEPFRHWDADDPAEVPTSCAKCHSTDGYQDFLGADGSEVNKVDAGACKDARAFNVSPAITVAELNSVTPDLKR